MNLHESTTEVWRHDLSHPDGYGGKNHEGAGTRKESEDEEGRNILTASQHRPRDDDQRATLALRQYFLLEQRTAETG